MEVQLEQKAALEDLTLLYREVFPSVASVVKKYGGVVEDAKDVFHDALLIWMERTAEERSQVQNHTAYLVTIARNEWFRRVEKAGKLRTAEPLVPEEELEVSNELYNYLVKTGRKCLDLLQAFYYEKLSATAIAGRFGFSGAHSASAQKYKCLDKLRRQVKADNKRKEDFYES